MSYDDFYDLMRRANEEQREILFHTMHHLISTDEPMREPLLIYLTGPAVLIIDEISMVSAELLEQINARLKQITGLFTKDFGGLDVILIEICDNYLQ
ncbi:hypothetical protein TNCV_3068951 [Trichonephila clavipes]|nr:hypothetical protein TNCV_3068951 [Trichonephila clavipes]